MGAWPILFGLGVDVPARGSVASQPSGDPLFTPIRAEKTFERSRRRGNFLGELQAGEVPNILYHP
jgi:hypothetical protein